MEKLSHGQSVLGFSRIFLTTKSMAAALRPSCALAASFPVPACPTERPWRSAWAVFPRGRNTRMKISKALSRRGFSIKAPPATAHTTWRGRLVDEPLRMVRVLVPRVLLKVPPAQSERREWSALSPQRNVPGSDDASLVSRVRDDGAISFAGTAISLQCHTCRCRLDGIRILIMVSHHSGACSCYTCCPCGELSLVDGVPAAGGALHLFTGADAPPMELDSTCNPF